MNYVPRDIRQIKLVTGDELLTEVVGEDQIEFLIRNPLKVFKERMLIKGTPREANFFTRWMSFADNQEFIIDKRHIVTEAIVDDNVNLSVEFKIIDCPIKSWEIVPADKLNTLTLLSTVIWILPSAAV